MKKIIAAVLSAYILSCVYMPNDVFCGEAYAKEDESQQLYARSAVLMDADSGRVLFAKNSREELPMASTTKIMTCILALEKGRLSDSVKISERAAGQPKVILGINEGESYFLEDLLYSLMLESHNDSAAAVAEHIGGSIEGFARLMNEKAKELHCEKTYFITPGGLDKRDKNGAHRTTAEDLALIMKYCIMDSPKKIDFLKITGAETHNFTDCGGKRSFTVCNHNTFLKMMDGALSGKTGYTSGAGYCYVGALRDKDRTFIVSLLACGWPHNKNYKWSDTKKLMSYALREFHYERVWKDLKEQTVHIKNGADPEDIFNKDVTVRAKIKDPDRGWKVMLGSGDKISVSGEIKKSADAPVKGQKVGYIQYFLNDKPLRKFDIIITDGIPKRTYRWSIKTVAGLFTDIFQSGSGGKKRVMQLKH